jgi:hypothetical protein
MVSSGPAANAGIASAVIAAATAPAIAVADTVLKVPDIETPPHWRVRLSPAGRPMGGGSLAATPRNKEIKPPFGFLTPLSHLREMPPPDGGRPTRSSILRTRMKRGRN